MQSARLGGGGSSPELVFLWLEPPSAKCAEHVASDGGFKMAVFQQRLILTSSL